MPNNNNAGMHYIHFASDKTALHEFDYDNQVGSRINKKEKLVSNQTSMWTDNGNPVDIKARIAQHRKEKAENIKKLEEELKKKY